MVATLAMVFQFLHRSLPSWKRNRLPVSPAFLLLALLGFPAADSHGAEVVRLNERDWETHAPQGKEADAIYGDWVLRNDRIAVVVADPIRGRNANMTTHNVGGAVIDMTDLESPSDQLTVFYPAPPGYDFRASSHSVERDGTAVLTVRNRPKSGEARVEVEYRLSDGDSFLRVRSRIANTTGKALAVTLRDQFRADTLFTAGWDEEWRIAWVYDRWFRQAYGVLVEGEDFALTRPVASGKKRPPYEIDYERDGSAEITLRPREKIEFERLLLCAPDTAALRATAGELRGIPLRPAVIQVRDEDGPVADARVVIKVDGNSYGSAYTDSNGRIRTALPHGRIGFDVSSLGRTRQKAAAEAGADPISVDIEMDQPGYVAAEVTDGEGRPIPCKVQFIGKGETANPHFFHEAGEHQVHNIYYSHDGKFVQPLAPGTYEVIVSYGPEHNAHFTAIEARRGQKTPLDVQLERVVQSRGWISAELHSHSSPSGDNVSSQRGRVLNLLAEHLEFAPCTEHNRIDSYDPHLQALGVSHLMATCPGMELTRSPLPLYHQNAFPLVHKPRTQDGGGPETDSDLTRQVRRLAYWDDKSEKIVQSNHPNIVQMFFDKDLDGRGDSAHQTILPSLDLIEVHPPHRILEPARKKGGDNTGGNRIHSWLQMLNQGMWLPGVVNTDAHWNDHGSGGMRNYVHSPVDDPAKVKVMDLVASLRKGNIVMSNGPFMEVFLDGESGRMRGIPGDTITAPNGKVRLHLRVQCSNWLDIDRVQILINGRRPAKWNFTRESHPDWFGDEVVKFQRTIPIDLAGDAHLMVVAIGGKTTLGPVMGKARGAAMPIAVSNPVFVDVDGGGFQASGDKLDGPLPLESE